MAALSLAAFLKAPLSEVGTRRKIRPTIRKLAAAKLLFEKSVIPCCLQREVRPRVTLFSVFDKLVKNAIGRMRQKFKFGHFLDAAV